MTVETNPSTEVSGNEALTVGEKFVSFFKELSVGIDSFNAKNFNKSIHQIENIDVWKKLSQANVYFNVSTKHIPSPVFFNPNKLSFQEYVNFILKAVPILKLVDTQAEIVYRGIKTVAATGKVPFSISNVDNTILINEARAELKTVLEDTRVYTRAVSDIYPSFNIAYDVCEHFNKVTATLKSRDVEVTAKKGDQVINIIKILKPKIDNNEVILNERESVLLNNTISNLIDNITFAGQMLAQLSDLTRVLQLQVDETKKL